MNEAVTATLRVHGVTEELFVLTTQCEFSGFPFAPALVKKRKNLKSYSSNEVSCYLKPACGKTITYCCYVCYL